MLVLLGISSAIAVIIPNPRREAREREAREAEKVTGTTGVSGATGETAPAGTTGPDSPPAPSAMPGPPPGVETATVEVNETAKAGKRRIAVPPGSRLVLTVKTTDPSQVSIPALGRNGFADRWAPAVFDLILPTDPGRIPVYTAPPDGRKSTVRAVITAD